MVALMRANPAAGASRRAGVTDRSGTEGGPVVPKQASTSPGAKPEGKDLAPRAAGPATSPLTIVQVAILIIAALAIVAAARVAQPFLVPVIAGIMLSYILRPLVSGLERWHFPRTAAAAAVIIVLAGLVSAAGYALRDEVEAAVTQLPGAARKLRIAVTEATRRAPEPMISKVKAAAAELDLAAAQATSKGPVAAQAPVPDQVSQFQGLVARQAEMLPSLISEIVLAVLLAFFVLAAGDTFRRKVTRLAGESLARRRVTIEVLNQVDSQIQRYLLTLFGSNVLIALATWATMAALGLPNAGMWGAFTGLIHVIPYAGAAVSSIGIGIAMFVHTGSIAQAVVALAAVIVIATSIGVGLATWMQGRAFRMNAVAIFIGVLFFGWLWGAWGLLLGLPILAVLKSICDRIDTLHPVSELLAP
jgi:predicted PurR-regulated permease PerM